MTRKKIAKYIIYGLIGLILSFIIVVISYFLLWIWEKIELNSVESMKVYDRHQKLIYDIKDEYRHYSYESVDDIPQELIDFLIWKEDQAFFRHHWVDLKAIWRAFLQTIQWNKQWASTIDQQVIKLQEQAFSGRWLLQKVHEIRGALYLQLHYSKNEILAAYINHILFPYGAQWYRTACTIYFAKDCTDLSTLHYIYLYARSRYPHSKNVTEYAGNIAKQYGIEYKKEDFVAIDESVDLQVANNAPHYVNFIISEFKDQNTYSWNTIYTSYDLDLHIRVQKIFEQFSSYLNSLDAHDGCIVIMEHWELRSMNTLQPFSSDGSYINWCTRPRQVWSAIKPFIYSLAFNQLGYDQDTMILDDAVRFESQHWPYEPKNFDLQYHGMVSLWQALGSSLNIPAVKLVNELWLQNFYQFLSLVWNSVETDEKWHDDYNHFGLALGLGVKELSPLDFTRMWSVFSLCRSWNWTKKINWSPLTSLCENYATSFNQVKEILSRNDYRVLGFGQHNWLDIDWTYAKTWTSRHFIDGWACGGKNTYTVCVWIWNYNNDPMRTSWHDVAAPLWAEIMEFVL